jgi:riboflavin synthase
MFTGIVQGVASVQTIIDRPGLRTFTLLFAGGFTDGLAVGASVSVAGVCLTVTGTPQSGAATFDVMHQTMSLTTLGALKASSRVNVERSAHVGAEIGGHPLSGHVDFRATVYSIRKPQNNHVMRFAVPAQWTRYLFNQGFIAVNGASLTIAEVQREPSDIGKGGWFEVWLIPETLRATTFRELQKHDLVNVEVDRQTQILVDTVRAIVDEQVSERINERIEAVLGQLSPSMKRRVAASMARATPTGGHVTMATKKKAKKKLKSRDDPTGPHVVKPRDDPTGPHAKKPPKKKK